jgi:hypothetical protein
VLTGQDQFQFPSLGGNGGGSDGLVGTLANIATPSIGDGGQQGSILPTIDLGGHPTTDADVTGQTDAGTHDAGIVSSLLQGHATVGL